ncbi:MAG: hypothetical protein AB1750_21310 [Chloroflexota bacterium]
MSIPVRRTLLSLLLVLALAACAPTAVADATPTSPASGSSHPSLVGMWKGEYNGVEAVFTFEANGNISIASYGSLQGGTYSANYDTIPYQLDFVFETPPSTINTIFEFVDANTLKIANVLPGEPRPTEFADFILLYPPSFVPTAAPTDAP